MTGEYEYIPESICEDMIQKRNLIMGSIGDIPREFINGSASSPYDVESFDVNQILKIFDRVRLRNGYILDYVYAFDSHGGEPLIYARHMEEIPIYTPEEYYQIYALPRKEMLFGDEPNNAYSNPYLRHIEFENTPIGYFQFALFCFTVRRFYLHWHSNYNDRKFILTTNAFMYCVSMRIGQITVQDINCLTKTNWRPRTKIHQKAGEVVQLCYDMNIGYSLYRTRLEWPNIFVGYEDEVIVSAKSQILY